MYYIDDYKKRAVDKVIPYLIEFPQIVKILETNAERYQAIEDVLWKVAENFKVIDSRGMFLNAHAHNEVSDIIYTDKAQDAFTYGTDMPMFQAYGTGHYYSQASYVSGSRKSISEDKLIRAVQAKIIQNNTNGTVEDIIEALKLLYNAEHVKVYESNPLNLSIMLIGSSLEISSSGNYENIKEFLPACVSFNNIFVDTSMFDLFMYDENSSYGDSRYPIRIDETVDKYFYISFSVTLDSEFEEYVILNNEGFKENRYVCITGSFTKLNNNATLLSTSNSEEGLKIKTVLKDGVYYLAVDYNGDIYTTECEAKENERYTIITYNTGSQIKVWVSNKIHLKGKFISDSSYIENTIAETIPDVVVENYTNFQSPLYLNCLNTGNKNSNFGDFTYYAVVLGSDTEMTEYYASCYGEKQILFNCLANKNHLYINTKNPLVSNIMTKQSYYNYKQSHSAGKYLYFDGKSGIDYKLEDSTTECDVYEFDIRFDTCMPVDIKPGNIISNFVNTEEDMSYISVDENGALNIYFETIIETSEGEVGDPFISKNLIVTGSNTIKAGEYSRIRVHYNNSSIYVYKNDNLIYTNPIRGILHNIPPVIRIGYDSNLSSFYKGFIKNAKIIINAYIENNEDVEPIEKSILIDLPYKQTLQDVAKKIKYTNYGARFITTPQLINDTTNLDIYGNELLGIRIYKE